MVRDLQTRSERRGEADFETVWSFRLERYDDAGQRVMLIPVEMRGLGFEGSIHDGDQVRTCGRMRGGTLRVKRLENVTTGAAVQAKRTPKIVWVFSILFLCFVLAFMGWVFSVLFFGNSPGEPGPIP
ncbi:hypothetical protein OHB25_59145 [Streptomyces mirabilis]|uniref:hypothetical protein n=1 Tax=Streptomyces mirabilis TaxID=68239 RepID=UPI002E1F2936